MKEVTFQDPSLSTYDIYTFGNDNEGPQVFITAGIHGVEQTAIYVAYRLIELLPKYQVKGSIKVIPIVNKPAYFNRTRNSPYDNLDLNRVFPGDEKGTQTMQLAHSIWRETRSADYIIDLHCCGQHGSNYVMSLYQNYDAQYELAHQLGIRHVVRSGGASGQLFLEACKYGQQAALLELKGGQPDGMIDLETSEFAINRLLRFLSLVDAIEIENINNDIENCVFHDKIGTICADEHGFFNPKCQSGHHYLKGEVLGELNQKPIVAQYDGLVTAVNYPRYTFTGERMIRYAKLNKEK
ncbi:M14 family metallopeptidase [Staphylococcus schleiferi]|uniref:M14 family metallopeptidase n=1 Tax=Staphylococcus schleiferi TaxID=1295 RepID=UPI00247FAFDC|nr:M14 family metallopeptidase [Staphylococcus schleiferi]